MYDPSRSQLSLHRRAAAKSLYMSMECNRQQGLRMPNSQVMSMPRTLGQENERVTEPDEILSTRACYQEYSWDSGGVVDL